MYEIIINVREKKGKGMAKDILEKYSVSYISLEELGNDGDLAYRLMEKAQEIEKINNQAHKPF